MQYLKLHNWCYHIINSIQDFGAINSFTTETYENLHKECVKNPYQMSNHRDAKLQMLNTVSNFYLIIFNINNTKLVYMPIFRYNEIVFSNICIIFRIQ